LLEDAAGMDRVVEGRGRGACQRSSRARGGGRRRGGHAAVHGGFAQNYFLYSKYNSPKITIIHSLLSWGAFI
jgi:hypothetical protein